MEKIKMNLREFTTFHDTKIDKITRARFVIADTDLSERKEWIEGQVAIDVPTLRNGADLRARVLLKVRDELDTLIKDFQLLDERAQHGR
jgi:hypothetical protein